MKCGAGQAVLAAALTLGLGVQGALAPPAVAQVEQASEPILTIDMERIKEECRAGVGILRQIDELRERIQEEMARRRDEIRAEERSLAEQRDKLQPSEFRARVRAFEKKVAASQEYAQRETRRLQGLRVQAGARLRNEATKIAAQILRERDARLLLDKTQIVLGADELDITDEAIARLDETVPNIPLERPNSEAE